MQLLILFLNTFYAKSSRLLIAHQRKIIFTVTFCRIGFTLKDTDMANVKCQHKLGKRSVKLWHYRRVIICTDSIHKDHIPDFVCMC